jgi:hypothetical protein
VTKAGIATIAAGGGLVALGAWLASRKADEHVEATKSAVESGGQFKVHATGYWPFSAKESEKKMEGGVKDRKGNPLHTVEDFFAGRSDHASVSGDDSIFPYGQKIIVNWFDKQLVGRVTDTGGHFRGAGKVYRVVGEEPLDFCVESSKTPVPKKDVVATIVVGDHLDKSRKAVATGKFKGQEVTGFCCGLLLLGARDLPTSGRPAPGWSRPMPHLMGPAIRPA